VLLSQCIDVFRLFPSAMERRPTVTLVPKWDGQTPPKELMSRLEALKKRYSEMIEDYGASFAVLGDPEDYFKAYWKEDMVRLRSLSVSPRKGMESEWASLSAADRWMVPVAKGVASLDDYKYPVILVAECGWNMFRQSAACSLALERAEAEGHGLTLRTSTEVTGIRRVEGSGEWAVTMKAVSSGNAFVDHFDFMVNAAGFESGTIDDEMLSAVDSLSDCPVPQRMVEFKSAFMSRWDDALRSLTSESTSITMRWPEVIFHGVRGTPRGMAQLTPYSANHFQLHGMTNTVTLFQHGLVSNTDSSAQPQLDAHFLQKLDCKKPNGMRWTEHQKRTRTQNAIKFVGQFVPRFGAEAKMLFVDDHYGHGHHHHDDDDGDGEGIVVGPFCGAQQIPGRDSTLRAVNGVSFLGDGDTKRLSRYCRAEIVKASSAMSCAENVLRLLTATDGLLNDAELWALKQAIKAAGRPPGRVLTAGDVLNGDAPIGVLHGITDQDVLERAKAICRERGYPPALAEFYPDH